MSAVGLWQTPIAIEPGAKKHIQHSAKRLGCKMRHGMLAGNNAYPFVNVYKDLEYPPFEFGRSVPRKTMGFPHLC